MDTKKTRKVNIRFGFKHPVMWVWWIAMLAATTGIFALVKYGAALRLYMHNGWAITFVMFYLTVVTVLTWLLHGIDCDMGGMGYSYGYSREPEPVNLLPWILSIAAIVTFLYLIFGALFSKGLTRAKSLYERSAAMVEVIEDTEETSAFPNLLGKNNDTSNLPLIGTPEAMKRAETEMGRFPALGSQFELVEADMTSQSIDGELCYVIPLQPKNFWKWDKTIGNHGYFIIDRNTGDTTFVEESLFTTTQARLGDNTKRVINKYLAKNHIDGLVTDISPEVDDDGVFHYVGTVYTIDGVEGFKTVKGIVDVNGVTKECQYYDVDEVPAYVDRVYPEEFFEEYIGYYGNYVHGFWNSAVGQREVQEPTADMDVIYIDGECWYYTGWTSAGKGESSNGIIMMNSRDGRIELHRTYGISEDKAQGVAMGLVQEKLYVASYPLLLQVAGNETYFMLMRDGSNNLVGYAFVSYKDYTKAAVGSTLMEAQANYVKSLAASNSASAFDESSNADAKGTISQIANEVVDGNTIYYVKVNGSDTIFQMTSKVDPNIVFAQPGDKVAISFYDSGSEVETATACEVTLTQK